MKGKYVKIAVFVGMLLLAGWQVISLKGMMTDMPFHADALGNVTMAFNLAHHGVVSEDIDPEGRLSPSDYREPLPIFALAAILKIDPVLSAQNTVSGLNAGVYPLRIKSYNLVWAFLLLVGVGAMCLLSTAGLTGGVSAALLAMWGTFSFFLQSGGVMDTCLTEIHAAVFLAWVGVAFIQASRSWKIRWFVVAGAMLGCLALSKGIFLYVGLAFVLVAAATFLAFPGKGDRKRICMSFLAMLLVMMAVVTPWMVRNKVRLGAFEINQRGGVVMMIRAKKEMMTDIEYRGAWWYYAPAVLQRGYWPALRGDFSMGDLGENGRLKRLNRQGDAPFAQNDRQAELDGRPDLAVSFYGAGRAERIRLRNMYRQMGFANYTQKADAEMQRQSMDVFLSDPLRHMRMSALFMWRGMWCMSGTARNVVMLNALAWLALACVAVAGILRRDGVMMGIAMLPMGAATFMALLTHYIPRYSWALIPSLLVSLCLCVVWGGEWFLPRLFAVLHNQLCQNRKEDRLDSKKG